MLVTDLWGVVKMTRGRPPCGESVALSSLVKLAGPDQSSSRAVVELVLTVLKLVLPSDVKPTRPTR